MPPKASYTREDIIEAAFEVLRDQGMTAVSARKIAEHLRSSTQPVYSSFASMDELKQAVLEKVQALMLEYSARQWSDRVFLNLGVGLLAFCRDHQRLYRALFLDKDADLGFMRRYVAVLQERLRDDTRFNDMPPELRDAMLERMWIFTHGIAALICNGYLADTSLAALQQLVDETGTAVIRHMLAPTHNAPDTPASAAG